jgi:hypothetical protein
LGNDDSPRRDLHELTRLLVVLAGNVVELDAVEFVLERAHSVAVGLHHLIVAARILHDLVDYELRVSPDVEALNADFNGDSEATKEGLVLHHVV